LLGIFVLWSKRDRKINFALLGVPCAGVVW
jgi:hypothetical protein